MTAPTSASIPERARASHFARVLEVLGRSATDVALPNALDPAAALLRANAWERLGRVEQAADLLVHLAEHRLARVCIDTVRGGRSVARERRRVGIATREPGLGRSDVPREGRSASQERTQLLALTRLDELVERAFRERPGFEPRAAALVVLGERLGEREELFGGGRVAPARELSASELPARQGSRDRPRHEPVAQSALGNPFLFTGRRYDAETGLYYYRARYLDPVLGEFISRDPIGMWGDEQNLGNGLAYAGNDPWNRRDPSGLDVTGVWDSDGYYHVYDGDKFVGNYWPGEDKLTDVRDSAIGTNLRSLQNYAALHGGGPHFQYAGPNVERRIMQRISGCYGRAAHHPASSG